MIVSLIGPPASGKGTQSRFLQSEYGFHVLSISAKIKEAKENDAEFSERVDAFQKENPGELIPDEMFQDRIAGWIQELKDEHGEDAKILLDGYPRTLEQAEYLDSILDSLDEKLDAAICLEFTQEETDTLVDRQIKRGQQAIIDGEKPRDDDLDENVARRRVEIFWDDTYPAIEKYDVDGRAIHVRGTDSIEDVSANIACIIDAIEDGSAFDFEDVEPTPYMQPTNIWGMTPD